MQRLCCIPSSSWTLLLFGDHRSFMNFLQAEAIMSRIKSVNTIKVSCYTFYRNFPTHFLWMDFVWFLARKWSMSWVGRATFLFHLFHWFMFSSARTCYVSLSTLRFFAVFLLHPSFSLADWRQSWRSCRTAAGQQIPLLFLHPAGIPPHLGNTMVQSCNFMSPKSCCSFILLVSWSYH